MGLQATGIIGEGFLSDLLSLLECPSQSGAVLLDGTLKLEYVTLCISRTPSGISRIRGYGNGNPCPGVFSGSQISGPGVGQEGC